LDDLTGLKFTPKKNTLSLPDANTRLQAVIAGNGLGMQDEFAEPEIESGQLVWLSDIAISNFAYCIVLPTKGELSPVANIFVNWIRTQDF
jgi:DNA-binding transcriptional LysR family regulator